MAFNNGKAYHGSNAIRHGKLIGRSGKTDYFFFLCPKCNDGQILRVLEYEFREATEVERREKRKPRQHFNLAFHLWCPICQFEDFIKIDNNHHANKLEPSAAHF